MRKAKSLMVALVVLLVLGACGVSRANDDVVPISEGLIMPSPTAGEVALSGEAEVVSLAVSGGAVNFCDALTVSTAGEVALETCETNSPITANLDEPAVNSLQTWYTHLASFEINLDATEDAPAVSLNFNGAGTTVADAVQQQIILDWANGLLVQTRPKPTPIPVPSATPVVIGPEGLCPEVQRPAMMVANYDTPESFILVNAATQTTCNFALQTPPAGRLQSVGGFLYYPSFDRETESMTIWRLGSDGTETPLSFTAMPLELPGPISFVVSADGSKIAWSRTQVNTEAEPFVYTTDVWVATIDGSAQVTLLEQVQNTDSRYVELVRFSADNQTLFYAHQPDGLGGSLFAFSGVYDTIYALPVSGGEAQLIHACPGEAGAVCIGDVSPDGSTLVYTDVGAQLIYVLGTDGTIINTISPPATDFIGRATFSPAGNLAFTAGVLTTPDDALPLPNPGYLGYLAPPYTGNPQILVSDNSVAVIWEWLSDTQVAYGSLDAEGNMGTAVVSLEGQVTPLADSHALTVLR